jgi:hypothetical protein
LIGAAADWGTGAAIGAGAGAAVGIGAVLLTRGRPTVLEPEEPLNFRLVDPVRIDTTQSQHAFCRSPSRILTAVAWSTAVHALRPRIRARTLIHAVTTVRVTPIPASWDFMMTGTGAAARVSTATVVIATKPSAFYSVPQVKVKMASAYFQVPFAIRRAPRASAGIKDMPIRSNQIMR